ncbi:MAG TPA: hypothetical protein VFV35_05025 [Acidimicrobiales bacterium]|nr:hypothetical protein [Acidimicrobiales bacterium]
MAHWRVGVAMLVLGAALMAGGVLGMVAGGDDEPAAPAVEAASAASTSTTSTTTTCTTTTSTTIPTEDVAGFVERLAAAIRAGDEAFLFERLHPEVLARYGEATCRARLATFEDPSLRFTVHGAGPPGDYDWTTDGRTSRVPGTVTVPVTRVDRVATTETEIHVTRVAGEWRWFTDCGDPA